MCVPWGFSHHPVLPGRRQSSLPLLVFPLSLSPMSFLSSSWGPGPVLCWVSRGGTLGYRTWSPALTWASQRVPPPELLRHLGAVLCVHPPTSSSFGTDKGWEPRTSGGEGIWGKCSGGRRGWAWCESHHSGLPGLCTSLALDFKSAGPGFGAPEMTAVWWEVGQKMKLERGQAGHCRDPKSCP